MRRIVHRPVHRPSARAAGLALAAAAALGLHALALQGLWQGEAIEPALAPPAAGAAPLRVHRVELALAPAAAARPADAPPPTVAAAEAAAPVRKPTLRRAVAAPAAAVAAVSAVEVPAVEVPAVEVAPVPTVEVAPVLEPVRGHGPAAAPRRTALEGAAGERGVGDAGGEGGHEAAAADVSDAADRPPAVEAVEAVEAVAASALAAAPAGVLALGAAAQEPSALRLPVYPTALPAPFRWRYRLQRGLLSGEGELRFERAAEGYEARLQGRIAGLSVLDWHSQGRIDAAGLAPERFVVRRRGGNAQAANFRRDVGKISYSGPTVEHPLPPGAQDRLSWMLQLPAVLAADPQRLGANGATVSLFVSGARGDADVWVFRVVTPEAVALGAGEVATLKLVREPRKPRDVRVEAWLAPAMSYLPVRARLTPPGGGDALELLHLPD